MKKTKRKTLIEWLVLIAVILVFAYTGWHKPLIVQLQRAMIYTGLLSPDISQPPVVTNHGVYDLTLRDEDSNLRMLSEFRGKVIFINFWATWCPPCRAEMPGINSLFSKMQDRNLEYIILTTERDFGKAMEYKANEGFDFPIYQLAGKLPAVYQESAIPRSYVVSRDGRLIMEHTGLADYDSRKFREFLKKALEERSEI